MNEKPMSIWISLEKKRVEPQAEKACYYCDVCILNIFNLFVEN
jgi:hypothetical protein